MFDARPFFSAAPSVSAGCSLTSPVLFPAVPAVAAARARPPPVRTFPPAYPSFTAGRSRFRKLLPPCESFKPSFLNV